MIHDLWYKNAVVYCLNVETFLDSNGDGVGDFVGLTDRLDYLAGLGITCIWLLPFYPSPNRDDGYDVADFYGVHPRTGTFGDFVEFMNHARQLGLRVIIDLVVNHTSDQHMWFTSARKDPASAFRNWYVWSKRRPKDWNKGMVFPGVQKATWTRDPVAGEYYFHRFYDFQPDLDTHNPAVKEELMRIMGFWLQLGVSGFRMDAVPFVIERKGARVRHVRDYELLHEMRDFLQWRCRDAILLAEANVPPDQSMDYFGDRGDRLQMMLNFWVNQRTFYALATGDTKPLKEALLATYRRPYAAQWGVFLRTHDELDLGRLTDAQREQVFAALGPDKNMQLYDRGIRRRLAPMLHNDRQRIELAYSLMFTLPGTPVMRYGDEIGMGDNLDLPERYGARTPMQWSKDRHGGFSTARRIIRPVIDDPIYGYERVNVADQRRDAQSLLNWTQRVIRMRKECPEISWGDWKILNAGTDQVLAMRYDYADRASVFLHNFGDKPCAVRLRVDGADSPLLVNLLTQGESQANEHGRHVIVWSRTATAGFAWEASNDRSSRAAPQIWQGRIHQLTKFAARERPRLAGLEIAQLDGTERDAQQARDLVVDGREQAPDLAVLPFRQLHDEVRLARGPLAHLDARRLQIAHAGLQPRNLLIADVPANGAARASTTRLRAPPVPVCSGVAA